MADNFQHICVLEVNLQCCKSCPKKLNKKLQKIIGVRGVNIDTEKGLLIIAGSVDPSMLINTTEKFGKRAKLLAYGKDPMHANKKLDHFLNNMPISQAKNVLPSKDKKDGNQEEAKDHHPTSSLQDSDSDDDYLNPNHNDNHDHDYDDDNARYICPSVANGHLHKEPNNISWHQPNHSIRRVFEGRPRAAVARPRYLYPNYHPMIYSRPLPMYAKRTRPPLPYPFSIYEQQELTVGNDLHHIFSDENVKACSVM